MKEWKMQRGSQRERPEEVDKTSSPTTVYLRRKIERVEILTEGTEAGTSNEWQYEEMEMNRKEYDQMLLMQQVASENTSTIVASVTEFQESKVIDEYTMQLVEEGLL